MIVVASQGKKNTPWTSRKKHILLDCSNMRRTHGSYTDKVSFDLDIHPLKAAI